MVKRFIFALICCCYLPIAVAAGNAAVGKEKSASCAACHGLDGNSFNPVWPKIAGQSERYLYEQLRAFQQGKEGPRYNEVMLAQVANLSDQDLQDLSAFYAKQTPEPGKASPENLEYGQQLYQGGNFDKKITACIACHGPSGKGMPQAAFPLLSGQHAEYTILQLKAYRDGSRATDPNNIMRSITARMDMNDIAAVANYIQGLH